MSELRDYFDKSYAVNEHGCWMWTGPLGGRGYGRLHLRSAQKRKLTLAHRLSWFIHTGEHPGDLFVCHRCDVRLCVNPDHLFLGTALDNMRDMISKGREGFRPNIARAAEQKRSVTHCPRGHEYNEENTRTAKLAGRPQYLGRRCRACGRLECQGRRNLARAHSELLAALSPTGVVIHWGDR